MEVICDLCFDLLRFEPCSDMYSSISDITVAVFFSY